MLVIELHCKEDTGGYNLLQAWYLSFVLSKLREEVVDKINSIIEDLQS